MYLSIEGVYVNTVGDVYIADSYNHRIRFIDAATNIITFIVCSGMRGNQQYDGSNGPATGENNRLFNDSVRLQS